MPFNRRASRKRSFAVHHPGLLSKYCRTTRGAGLLPGAASLISRRDQAGHEPAPGDCRAGPRPYPGRGPEITSPPTEPKRSEPAGVPRTITRTPAKLPGCRRGWAPRGPSAGTRRWVGRRMPRGRPARNVVAWQRHARRRQLGGSPLGPARSTRRVCLARSRRTNLRYSLARRDCKLSWVPCKSGVLIGGSMKLGVCLPRTPRPRGHSPRRSRKG